MIDIEVEGETLSLMPERAAYWHREHALLIADPHWGKAAAFRAGGIPVPSGTTNEAIERLESLTRRTKAKRIFFLGDLLHAKEGRSPAVFSALGAWRESRKEIAITLVRGNHDKRAGDPPENLHFQCANAPHVVAPFILAHHPVTSDAGYVIAGHVHPGIRLYGPARQRERLPCFTFGKTTAILPAFGDFTGLYDIDPDQWTRIYAVANDSIVEIEKADRS